uniref:Uncharacterized protein n=1 Tax=Cacopsylla melanoneura TaxID=428564 RepID=A0A8D8WZ07_9HEMI
MISELGSCGRVYVLHQCRIIHCQWGVLCWSWAHALHQCRIIRCRWGVLCWGWAHVLYQCRIIRCRWGVLCWGWVWARAQNHLRCHPLHHPQFVLLVVARKTCYQLTKS